MVLHILFFSFFLFRQAIPPFITMTFHLLSLPQEIRPAIYLQILFVNPLTYHNDECAYPGKLASKPPSPCIYEPVTPDENGQRRQGVVVKTSWWWWWSSS